MNKKLIPLFFACIVLLLSGCSNNTDKEVSGDEYIIYFCDSSRTTLVEEKFNISSEISEEIIDQLLNYMSSDKSPAALSVFYGTNIVTQCEYIDSVIYVTLNDNYLALNAVDRVLAKAALVKTLVQTPGVSYVSFYINDTPMLNQAGASVVMYDQSGFVDDTKELADTVRELNTILYYADETGQKLIGKQVKFIYDQSTSRYQAVVEQLIKGPTDRDCYSTIPANVKVLGVSIKDGICYVNFDSAFADSISDNSAEITIYSIVNSLCELGDITEVQFMVNGSQTGSFRDKFPLSTSYKRNLDIVSRIDRDN